MAKQLALTNTFVSEKAVAHATSTNYKVTAGGRTVTLKRGDDFDKLPNAKAPSLLQSGAQKIADLYGFLPILERVTAIEDYKEPFFMYGYKCSLCKIVDGEVYTLCTAYGNANTKEKRNGNKGAFDATQNCEAMAQKRAFVRAIIQISGISDLFTYDMDNENFNKTVDNLQLDNADPSTPISQEQRKRLFAIAKTYGMGTAELKAWLKDKFGLESTNDITRTTYDNIVAELQKGE